MTSVLTTRGKVDTGKQTGSPPREGKVRDLCDVSVSKEREEGQQSTRTWERLGSLFLGPQKEAILLTP